MISRERLRSHILWPSTSFDTKGIQFRIIVFFLNEIRNISYHCTSGKTMSRVTIWDAQCSIAADVIVICINLSPP